MRERCLLDIVRFHRPGPAGVSPLDVSGISMYAVTMRVTSLEAALFNDFQVRRATPNTPTCAVAGLTWPIRTPTYWCLPQ